MTASEEEGPAIGPELEAELMEMIAAQRTVAAIKRLREANGWGLSQALHWVHERWLVTPRQIVWTGPPCPYCAISLRSNEAKQCFECGMDWHDPENVVQR